MADSAANIRKLLEDGKLVIGTERTLKLLRAGKIAEVFFSSNCAAKVRETLARYCGLGSVPCTELPFPNEELGVVCKKPFAISVVGVLRTG